MLAGLRERHFGERLRGTPHVARFEDAFEHGGSLWLVFVDEARPCPRPNPHFPPDSAPNPRRGITLGRLINNAGQIAEAAARGGIALLPSYPAVRHTGLEPYTGLEPRTGLEAQTSRAQAGLRSKCWTGLLLTRVRLALVRRLLQWVGP